MKFPFRYCVKEREKDAILFEITADTPQKFFVRFPEFDYIKEAPRMCVEYNREQLLCFMLAYDRTECKKFMEKLYSNMDCPDGYMQRHIYENPLFADMKGDNR